MRVGVWMPTAMPFELERSFFLDWVRFADQAGFDTLSSLDRPNYDMWDPLASLAAAAAVTQRIRLATTTLPLPNRNEVLVAKQAAVIDRLSNGRLTLGVAGQPAGRLPGLRGDAGASRDPLPPPGRHPPTGMGGGTAQ